MLTILTIAAEEARRVAMLEALAGRGDQHIISVMSPDAALRRLERAPVDVVLADRPAEGWSASFRTLQATMRGRLPLILLQERPELAWEPRVASRPAVEALSFELEIDNDRSRIPKMVELLMQQAQRLGWLAPPDEVRARVSLEEALMNAVVHGNLEVRSELRERDDDSFEEAIAQRLRDVRYSPRRVNIDFRGDQSRVRWVIRDEGPGFDVRSVPDPRLPAQLGRVSGRGVLLMRSLMDGVRFNDRGNEVELVKLNSGRTGCCSSLVARPEPLPALQGQ